MEVLNSYINGNTEVTIYSDGTKYRSGPEVPVLVHPESIDVKITNYCDAGCKFCHEKSTLAGKHGDLDQLSKTLLDLPAGVEIAIGGGNPLSHPDLNDFLFRCQKQGLICNITINQKHLQFYQKEILFLIKSKLVHGVGISYLSSHSHQHITPIIQATDNVVFHLIMGVNRLEQVDDLLGICNNKLCKILLLGYKRYGFGIDYFLNSKNIEANQYNWYTALAKYFSNKDLVLSFDNLAIDQLNLKRFFTDDAWKKFYMGDDFAYTMYVDGVDQNYAPSSTSSDRVSFKDLSLLEYFQKHRRSP